MQIRNISDDDLIVPWLGGRLVAREAVVDVGADDVLAYLAAATTWAAADPDATAAWEAAQPPKPAAPAAPPTAL